MISTMFWALSSVTLTCFFMLRMEPSSARSKATEILKAGQKAAAIVQDLLTLARRGVQDRNPLT